MKVASTLLFACLSATWAQTPPSPGPTAPPAAARPAPTIPNLPDDTQIAVFEDGVKFTMGEFKRIYGALPPENQQMALRDRQLFLQQWGLMRKLAQLAMQEKLDEQSPTKEHLDYYRMMILSQAKLQNEMTNTAVQSPEIVKYYDVNKEKYKIVKVKAIYVAFSDDPADSKGKSKKMLTDAQAKAKATSLLEKLHAGADFVALVKENSDDETSRAKDGDFVTLRPTDNVPDAVRTAVFALKKGEISEPVRQQAGYYLLKADDVTYRPLSQVRDEIFQEIKQQHYGEWMDKINRDTKVTLTSPEFIGATPLAMPAK